MAYYTDIVVDQLGVPKAGVSVTPLDKNGNIFAVRDNDGNLLILPLVTNANGMFYFNAPDGVYRLEYRYGGRVAREDDVIVGIPPEFVGPAGPSANVLNALGQSTSSAASQKAVTDGLAGKASLTGPFAGNASTASTLANSRLLAATGDVTWSVNFNGSGNVSGAASISSKAVSNTKLADMSTGTLKGALVTGSPTDLTAVQAKSLLALDQVANQTPTQIISPLAAAAGASLVGFQQGGTGAVARTVNIKFAETPSVRDYGATQDDGTTSQQAYFSATAQAAIGRITTTAAFSNLPTAPTAEIRVPDGLYHLTDYVDSGNTAITWICGNGARFTPNSASFLLGKVVRQGRASNGFLYGTLDSACGQSTMVGNGSFDQSPLINGVTTPDQIAISPTLDAAAQYVDITGVPLIHQSAATFTANTAICSVAVDIRKLRVGMAVQTTHSPFYRGLLTSWSADGKTLTVTSWRQQGTTTAATPVNTGSPQVLVGPIDKLWARNANLFLTTEGYSYQGTIDEMGFINLKGTPSTAEDALYRIWGGDVVNLGTNKGSIGYIVRGSLYEGFRATGTDTGFVSSAFPSLGYAVPNVGFLHKGATPAFRQTRADNTIEFQVTSGKIDAQKMAIYALVNAASDAAASAAGVGVGEIYHNAGALRIRLT